MIESVAPGEPFASEPEEFELSFDHAKRYHASLGRAGVALVDSIRLVHTGSEARDGLSLTVGIAPEIGPNVILPIGTLQPGETWECSAVDLGEAEERLWSLADRAALRVEIELRQGEQCLLARGEPFELLGWDEWGGLMGAPEALAAFVRPEHPAIERVLAQAARPEQGLGVGLRESDLEGRAPARSRARAAALFAAARELGVTWVQAPGRLEAQGQRIRPLEELAAGRPGTSLDLSLFLAACLERAGLHPLVGLANGQAFAGLWLVDATQGPALRSDRAELRALVEAGEIALFEAAQVASLPARTFGEAEQAAARHLEEDGGFVCLVDIRAARARGIGPLPGRGAAGKRAGEAAVALEPARMRLDRWRKKLLDLTLRNRLIHFRETRMSVRLLCQDPAGLEDALAGGASFRLAAEPPEGHAVGEGSLACALTEAELSRRLLDLYRASRLSLEESGAGTLYLALGFLAWYEDPGSEIERRAPILLLPMEILRPSVREGFRVRQAEEDPLLNVTLLRKLETDFGLRVEGLEELPTDESGLDVAAILERFRQAVAGVARWKVLPEAWLGLFSFTKFLMWRDLERLAGDLTGNPVVDRLLAGSGPGRAEGAFPDPATLDATHPPQATFCPLDADASQLAAVFAAAEGQSFVLQGPPGTGKSQTIANLIAHSLAEGRRVLFVAEKRAALEVVQRRLKALGLDSFCLEVHSNKANKRAVVAHLGEALEQARAKEPRRWAEEAARLGALREELNRLVEALHQERPAGLTFHQALGRLVELGEGPEVALEEHLVQEADRAEREALREALETFALAAGPLGELARHPWRSARRSDWSPALSRRVGELLGALGKSLEAARETFEPVGALLGIDPETASFARLELCDRAAALLPDSPRPAPAFLEERGFEEIREATEGFVRLGRCREELVGRLFPVFEPSLLELDLRALRQRLHRAESGLGILRWLRRRCVCAALAKTARSRRFPAGAHPGKVLEDALMLGEIEQQLAGEETFWGGAWQGVESDWDRLERELAWVVAWRELLAASPDRALWAELAGRGPTPEECARLESWRAAFEALQAALAALLQELALDRGLAWGGTDEEGFLERVRLGLEDWELRHEELREWCAFLRTALPLRAGGAGALAEAVEAGAFAPKRSLEVFDRSFLRPWAEALMEQEPLLGGFFGGEQERRIQTFQDLDRRWMALVRDLIRARLCSRLPPAGAEGAAGSNSEMAILRREVRKRARHLPLRRLFAEIPNLLGTLAPCFLMSPLSAAQYLDPEMNREEPFFDLVVFDEASQIPPWDALGALARARQAVVVGDSRQLPPTSFFQRLEGEDDAVLEDDLDDLESILEECEAAGLPALSLLWHFRSRHESLIAFSNRNYYENRLTVFPSPERGRGRLGVALRLVPDAVYGKGGSRTNRREAEEVVAEVVRRLLDPDEAGRSIGVVTFNLAQQRLIEDLLDQARGERPELEAFFAEETEEPVFVKNLENVQGDERDVILFSVCYGPDAAGRVSMNFGPLNRKGGERRLNVAVTRAREQVLIFSSITAERFDLSRTDALGVRHLRDFLDYAARGDEALAAGALRASGAALDSPLEGAIRRALEAGGRRVDSGVGSAGCTVDLAVLDPERPGRYLLGILCDGASYRSSRNARERDRLRCEVLQRLGWRLHRIWAVDWWSGPGRELERLEAAIAAASAEAVDPALAPKAPSPSLDEQRAITPAADDPEAESETDTPLAKQTPVPQEAGRAVYTFAPSADLGGPEDFYEPRRKKTVLERLRTILQCEAPIQVDLAARRLAESFHIEKLTARVRQRFAELLGAWKGADRPFESGGFLWLSSQDPDSYATWRVPAEGQERGREAGEIPPQESASAAAAILAEQVSLPRDELLRLTASRLGFGRMGKNVAASMEAGLALLERRGGCSVQNDRVSRPRAE